MSRHDRPWRRAAGLLDKQAITELLTRYPRSVDRDDVATLRSCCLLAPDPSVLHMSAKYPADPIYPIS